MARCHFKYLDGLEQDKAIEAEPEGRKVSFILDLTYRWEKWAAPKGKDGQMDCVGHGKREGGGANP